MKNPKKPTREQRRYIEKAGLDTYTTKVIKDTNNALDVLCTDGKVVYINKEDYR